MGKIIQTAINEFKQTEAYCISSYTLEYLNCRILYLFQILGFIYTRLRSKRYFLLVLLLGLIRMF